MTESGRDALAEALGELVRGAATEVGAKVDAVSRARLLWRAEADSGRRRSNRLWPWLALASAAAAMGAALLVWRRMPGALTYEVIGAMKDGVYVSAPDDRPITVRFSDATTLDATAGSRLRVEGATTRGARVLVERGNADVRVVHRTDSRWTFAAGPFDVLVTGTRFDLTWDPSVELFDLKLLEGSVDIQAPFGPTPVSLHAGQEFRADVRRRSLMTTEAGDADGGAPLPAEGSDPDAATPPAAVSTSVDDDGAPVVLPETARTAAAASARTPVSRGKAAKTWTTLVAAGQFGSVLAQVEERGVEPCLRSCSASELRAVADAARYSGRRDLAGKSLRALVARFGQETSGHEAAFWLGRLFEQSGDSAEAGSWYARYRAQAPDGLYAAEALAGAMRTTLAAQGRAAALSMAQEYLARYPAGADAATARGILGPP